MSYPPKIRKTLEKGTAYLEGMVGGHGWRVWLEGIVWSVQVRWQEYIIMANKQPPPQESAKKLQQVNGLQYHRYSKNMVQHNFPTFTIFGSYVVKQNKVIDTECILVLYRSTDKTLLGYAKLIYTKHPLVRRLEDINKQTDLGNIHSVYILDQTKLHLKYNLPLKGEIKEITFQFLSKNLLQQWVAFIHDQNAILRGTAPKDANPNRQRLESLQKQHKSVLVQYDNLKRICSEGEAKIQSLEVRQKEMQADMDELALQHKTMQGKAAELEEERVQLLKDIEEAITIKQQKEEECMQLAQQINALRQTQQDHEAQMNQLKQQLASSQQQATELRRQFEARELVGKQLVQERIGGQKARQLVEDEMASLKTALKQKQEQLDQQISNHNQQQQLINTLKNTIKQQIAAIAALSARSQQQSQQLEQYSKRQDDLQRQLQYSSALLAEKEETAVLLRLQGLFVGDALEDYHHHKLFLKDTLQAHRQLTLHHTRLLFRYDPLNKANFHHYIDHHPDLLLIVKTTDGAFLAGYTQSPISPNHVADRPGVIMSLTNQLAFELYEERRCVSYDEYYIIFGNSEIRLKSLQLMVFSNFGISNGFFHNKGMGVEALLCSPNREVPIETFELHRVYFSQ